MKTFSELTPDEQGKAITHCHIELLRAITEGGLRFVDDDDDDLQPRIDAALKKADEMRTPWFAHEYIMDTCREDIEVMARAEAEDALYLEPGQKYIGGIAGDSK